MSELEPRDEVAEALLGEVAGLLPDLPPTMRAQIAMGLRARKRARAARKCAKCGCRHIEYVEVEDAGQVERAVRLILEYAQGKPRQMQEGEGGPAFIIERVVRPREADERPAAA